MGMVPSCLVESVNSTTSQVVSRHPRPECFDGEKLLFHSRKSELISKPRGDVSSLAATIHDGSGYGYIGGVIGIVHLQLCRLEEYCVLHGANIQ